MPSYKGIVQARLNLKPLDAEHPGVFLLNEQKYTCKAAMPLEL